MLSQIPQSKKEESKEEEQKKPLSAKEALAKLQQEPKKAPDDSKRLKRLLKEKFLETFE